MSCESILLEDVERDCKGSKQQFCSSSVPCMSDREQRRCRGEMRFGIVLCSNGSAWEKSLGTEWSRFVIPLKFEKLKRGERRKDFKER